MHLNLSLARDGVNIFADASDPCGLSEEAYYFIGGLLAHMKGITAVANPLVNSYKRLVPGYEAPNMISWSLSNRTSLIRIPAVRGNGTRIELRSPDSAANPYLILALCLRAGLDGIRRRATPPEENGAPMLPRDLMEALHEMEQDPFVLDTLGAHISKEYIKAKKQEWDRFRMAVTDWEIDHYLYRI